MSYYKKAIIPFNEKTSLMLDLAMAFYLQLTAQTYKIDTSTINLENLQRPCFTVKYNASPKTGKKAWDDYFKRPMMYR
jgi:hypothetical protein